MGNICGCEHDTMAYDDPVTSYEVKPVKVNKIHQLSSEMLTPRQNMLPISDFDGSNEKDSQENDRESNFHASNSTAVESDYCQCAASPQLCQEDVCDQDRSKKCIDDLLALSVVKPFDNADLDKNQISMILRKHIQDQDVLIDETYGLRFRVSHSNNLHEAMKESFEEIIKMTQDDLEESSKQITQERATQGEFFQMKRTKIGIDKQTEESMI